MLLAHAWFHRSLDNLLVAVLVLFATAAGGSACCRVGDVSFRYHLFVRCVGALYAALKQSLASRCEKL